MTAPVFVSARPSLREWALLAINIVFVATGLFMLRSDPDAGIVSVAFFGTCLLVMAGVIIRKLRPPRPLSLQVEAAGGVPIRASKLLPGLIGAWLIALGVIFYVCGSAGGMAGYLICTVLLLGAGAWLLVWLATGRLASDYLQFDPPGLTFGHRHHRYTIRWDNIAGMVPGELSHNPVLLIRLHDPDLVEIDPPEQVMTVFRQWARNDMTIGAPIIIHPWRFRMNPDLLIQAVDLYITTPEARSQLARHEQLRR